MSGDQWLVESGTPSFVHLRRTTEGHEESGRKMYDANIPIMRIRRGDRISSLSPKVDSNRTWYGIRFLVND